MEGMLQKVVKFYTINTFIPIIGVRYTFRIMKYYVSIVRHVLLYLKYFLPIFPYYDVFITMFV